MMPIADVRYFSVSMRWGALSICSFYENGSVIECLEQVSIRWCCSLYNVHGTQANNGVKSLPKSKSHSQSIPRMVPRTASPVIPIVKRMSSNNKRNIFILSVQFYYNTTITAFSWENYEESQLVTLLLMKYQTIDCRCVFFIFLSLQLSLSLLSCWNISWISSYLLQVPNPLCGIDCTKNFETFLFFIYVFLEKFSFFENSISGNVSCSLRAYVLWMNVSWQIHHVGTRIGTLTPVYKGYWSIDLQMERHWRKWTWILSGTIEIRKKFDAKDRAHT